MKSAVIIWIAYAVIAIGGTIGWGMNIYKLCKADFEPSYKNEVIRGIGIPVAPLGAIVGFMDLGK